MFSFFYYNLAKWIFIALDIFLVFFFIFLLFKTKRFWEKPRLYYPWEKKRFLRELEKKDE